MKDLKIDVLIPTYKPNVAFGNMLKRLLKQTVQLNKIIVINTDESCWNPDFEAITDRLEVHHITKEEFGHGKSRNMAASYSDGDIILFMTQDAKPYDKYLIERLIKPLNEDESIWCSYARQLATLDCMEIERYTRIYNYPRQSHVRSKEDIEKYGIKTYFCSNSCAAYVKSRFDEMGGFDKEVAFGEDTVMAAEIIERGGKIAYCGDAVVIHSHNYTLKQQFKRNFEVGVMHKDKLSKFCDLKSEKEGIKLVTKTAMHLIEEQEYLWIGYLFVYSGAKYLGYFMGYHHKLFPRKKLLA